MTIFGQHSMAHDCCRSAVPVDYSMPLPKLSGMVLLHHMRHHCQTELPDASLFIFQRFHRNLGVELQPCPNTLAAIPATLGSSNENTEGLWETGAEQCTIQVTADLIGQISNLSSILSPHGHHKLAPGNIPISPRFEVNPSTYLCDDIWRELRHMNSEIDLVGSFQHTTSRLVHPVRLISLYTKMDTSEERQKRDKNRSELPEGMLPSDAQKVRNLLNELEIQLRRISQRGTKVCKLAVVGNPLSYMNYKFFVPPEASIGDIVFRFMNSDILAVGKRTSHVRDKKHVWGGQ